MATRPMNPVDAAWYHMDGPVNLAVVTGVLLTRTLLDFEKVKAVATQRLGPFERFRQRVVVRGFPIATPHWEDMPEFEIGQNMHHVALPAPRDRAALTAMISDLASTPLDRERPLWQIHIVDDVDGGSALIMRFHHCIADGTAMMTVSRQLFDTTPKARPAPAPTTPSRAVAPALMDRLFAPALGAVEQAARKVLAAVDAGLDAVRHPQQVIDKAAVVIEGAGMLVNELLKAPDPQSPLKGEFGMQKRVAWSEPVALDDVRAIGAPMGAKVNDVLVAVMTGALGAYLKTRRVDVEHMTVRAMVPVDLRPPERAQELGNEFGLVILELAVRSKGPLARLRTTKAHLDALKRSPEAVAIMTLFNLFGRGPKAVEDLAVDIFGSKASVVMTNVAGPPRTIYLAGTPLERIMFWVPYPGKQLGMGISIFSYRGSASLTVVSDARLVPDPEAITEQFNREFAKMLAAVRRGSRHAAAPKPARRRHPGRRTNAAGDRTGPALRRAR